MNDLNEVKKFAGLGSQILESFMFSGEEGIREKMTEQDPLILMRIFKFAKNAIDRCERDIQFVRSLRPYGSIQAPPGVNVVQSHGELEQTLKQMKLIFEVLIVVFREFHSSLKDYEANKRDVVQKVLKKYESQQNRRVSDWFNNEIREALQSKISGVVLDGEDETLRSVFTVMNAFKNTSWGEVEKELVFIAEQRAEYLFNNHYDLCFQDTDIS